MVSVSNVRSTIPPLVALIIPRLATDHVGELVATRDALVRSLSAVGLDLHDLAAACVTPSATTTASASGSRWPTSASAAPSFGDMARACRDLDHGRLATHERAFVADMVRRGFSYRPSPRQSAWLTYIFDQLQARAAA